MMKKSLHFLLLILLGIYSPNVLAQTGKSLVLNGTNQYMRIAHHSDFNITTTENFTITAWVKAGRYISDNSVAQRFITKRCMTDSPGDANTGYELWGAVSSSKFYANNAPNEERKHDYSMSVWSNKTGSLNTWFHIGIVVDRTKNKMYLYHDGVQVGTSEPKDVSRWYVSNSFDVMLGAGLESITTPTYFLKGEMDNVRFYKKALSTADIVTDKDNNSISPSAEGLVAAYDFENIDGMKVADLTGKHEGVLANFPVEGPAAITSARLTQDANFIGRGNENEVVLKAQVSVGGTQSVALSSLKLNLNGTTSLSDVKLVKVYSTGNSGTFDSRKVTSYTKLGECTPVEGDITCALSGSLSVGENFLWITCDVADKAKEGNKIDASLLSIITANETYTLPISTVIGAREILLARTLLFAPGDLGSTNYRIPGVVTAHDGSLVATTDKRKYNQSDLPEDIDILVNRSTDGGKTWSAALTIAQGLGRGKGFGDAAIARTKEPGGLICTFVGGQGFFPSTPSNLIRTYICKSSDNGVTWSAPVDITSQLFGSDCLDPVRRNWYGSFCGSGAGLLTRNGRICFVAAVRETSNQSVSTISNYVYYSDDNGATWNVSGCVMPSNANEAKIVELNDGSLLVSVRNQAKGPRYYSKSTDGGKTWSTMRQWNDMVEPGCDGDIIYYTSKKDGYEKNRILHSVPDNRNDRVNVSVFVSYDEAQTWPVKKSICPTGSAYSSLCILEDGTIGAYVEENYNTNDYSMYFTNFSLDWLTDGSDIYHAPGTVEAVVAPTFSIAGGSYEEDQTLVLATETQGAKIYYTIDGTIPTNASTLYEAPIVISETTTIKTVAVKEGLVDSPIASATYTFSPSGKYCFPVETATSNNMKDTYLKSVTTEGAVDNLNYTNVSRVFYTKSADVVEAGFGSTFTLHLVANSLGAYSTTDVKQDLRYAAAALFVDWDQDGEFSVAEGMKLAGATPPANNIGGNFDVLDITKSITVPTNAKAGKARARVVYNNAWGGDVLSKSCGSVADGLVYDFDINVVEQNYTLTITQPIAGGTVIVKNGDNMLVDNAVVKSGAVLTVEATPASDDYLLKNVLVGGKAIIGNQLTITSDVEVSAEFVQCTTFTYTFDDRKGKINVTNSGKAVTSGSKVELGSNLTVAISLENGCYIKGLTVNGMDKKEELLTNGNTFIFTVNAATAMEVIFDIQKFDLTCNTPLYGTMEIADDNGNLFVNEDKIEYGTVLNFVLIPAKDGDLLELLINDGNGEIDYVAEGYIIKEENGTYTTSVQAFHNITVNAKFKEVANSVSEHSLNCNIYLNQKGSLVVEGAAIGSVISVYNVTGQTIATIQSKQEMESIPVSEQVVYIVKIKTDSGSIVKKLAK